MDAGGIAVAEELGRLSWRRGEVMGALAGHLTLFEAALVVLVDSKSWLPVMVRATGACSGEISLVEALFNASFVGAAVNETLFSRSLVFAVFSLFTLESSAAVVEEACSAS